MKPCKIRINNPDHSKAVQEWLFQQGCEWLDSGKEVVHLNADYLYICSSDNITHDSHVASFSEDNRAELDLQHLDPHLPQESIMEENSLTRLHKAQADLQAAQEALNTAEKAHTDALEAFKLEAVGLLGESLKTPPASSQEDMSDISNWKKGDVLLCIKTDTEKGITKDCLYTYENESSLFSGYARIVNDNGIEVGYPVGVCLKWHSSPSK